MTTQKELINVFKETRGKLEVVAFNHVGNRISSYGGLDILTALKDVAKHNEHNPRVICLIVNSRTAPCAAARIEDYKDHIFKF